MGLCNKILPKLELTTTMPPHHYSLPCHWSGLERFIVALWTSPKGKSHEWLFVKKTLMHVEVHKLGKMWGKVLGNALKDQC